MRQRLALICVLLVWQSLAPGEIKVMRRRPPPAAGGGGPVTFTPGDHIEIIDTDGNNSITVAPPPNLASGNIWLIIGACDIDPGGTWGTDPSGFTPIGSSYTGTAGYPLVHSWWKVAGGSESNATLTTSGTDYDCVAYSLRLAGGSTIDQVGTPFTPSGSDTTIDAPDITVGANNSMAILIVSGDGSISSITQPTGSSLMDSRVSFYPAVGVAYQSVNSGSYAPSTWSLTSGGANRVARTISFKP